jgi:hypothetical protein
MLAILPACLIPAGFAGAQNYPWCAQYGDGARSCGFASREQCMTVARAKGGYCEPNYMYQSDDKQPASRKARRPSG